MKKFVDLTKETKGTSTIYKNIADVQGLQTIYRTVNTIPNGVPRQVLFPFGTRENLQIWTSNANANSSEIVGYVCTFDFPNEINQIRIVSQLPIMVLNIYLKHSVWFLKELLVKS